MRSEPYESGGEGAVRELIEAPKPPHAADGATVTRLHPAATQPRLVIALLLIVGGLVWAVARGLQFYGLSPEHLIYDLDQPPLLLVFVAVWLLSRSRA